MVYISEDFLFRNKIHIPIKYQNMGSETEEKKLWKKDQEDYIDIY